MDSPSLEAFRSCLDMVLGTQVSVALLEQRGWTRWLPEVPSQLRGSVSLWFLSWFLSVDFVSGFPVLIINVTKRDRSGSAALQDQAFFLQLWSRIMLGVAFHGPHFRGNYQGWCLCRSQRRDIVFTQAMGDCSPGQERSFQSQGTLHFPSSSKAAHLSCSVTWSAWSHTMNLLWRSSPTPTPPPLSPHHSDHSVLHVVISCENDTSYRKRATPKFFFCFLFIWFFFFFSFLLFLFSFALLVFLTCRLLCCSGWEHWGDGLSQQSEEAIAWSDRRQAEYGNQRWRQAEALPPSTCALKCILYTLKLIILSVADKPEHWAQNER